MSTERLPLSIGPGRPGRLVGVVFGLVVAGVGALFVLGPLYFSHAVDELLGGDSGPVHPYGGGALDPGDLPPGFGLSDTRGLRSGFDTLGLLGLCGVPFVVLGLYLAVRAARHAAWLDGTVVSVRGAVLTRSVDLASADVSAGAVTSRYAEGSAERMLRTPTLVARDLRTQRRVTVPLRGEGNGPLPPAQLRALADAMTATRVSVDADLAILAGQLRRMADNPFGP